MSSSPSLETTEPAATHQGIAPREQSVEDRARQELKEAVTRGDYGSPVSAMTRLIEYSVTVEANAFAAKGRPAPK